MAALYGNENVALQLTEALRRLGHDVLTSLDAGNANKRIPDGEVLTFAASQKRTVLTNNRADFHRLHATGIYHCGVITFTVDADFQSLAARIDSCLSNPLASGRFLAKVTQRSISFEE